MSIDEVMKFVERVSHYDPARPQDLSRLRTAIVLHVAEAVAREREGCAAVCQSIEDGENDAAGLAWECVDAIRARAEKETSNG